MSRRTDTDLRNAISVIERTLLTDPSVDSVLMHALKQLLALHSATFGYVYRCLNEHNNEVPWELVGCYRFDKGLLEDIPNSCTSDHMPDTLKPKLMSGRCINFSNGRNPIPMPHSHPSINDGFCVPLLDARRVYGVVYVCNAARGFDEDTENRLRPFIAATSCLLRAAEKKTKFQDTAQHVDHIPNDPESLMGLLDTIFNGVLVVSDADIITLCNHAAASMLGAPRREILGMPLSRFLPKGAPKLERRLRPDGQDDNQPYTYKTVWRGVPALNIDGNKLLVDLSAFELKLNGKTQCALVMDDISERIKSATDYHSTLQRFEALTNLVPVAILQLNREWECTYANDTWCEYSQMTPEEAHYHGWLRGLHDSDADLVLQNLRQETALSGKYDGEFRLQSPLGKVIWVKASGSSLYSEDGSISGLIITFSDITSHRDNERRLQNIAEKDQLTGLINRAFFNDRLDIALKGVERYGPVALMFIDLDNFKHVNDTLGHDAGDNLLREVANRLRDCLRQVDTIARIGGDEFTVILTNITNTRSITMIADKLLLALADPIIMDERPIYVSCSLGISLAEDVDVDSKQLLKQADAALYKAKEAGRNQYKFYTEELEKNANIHILLRQSLKDAGRDDFRVVYQPQVDAGTGEIIGFEALSRWSREDVDPIGPNVFVKMMEESGLIDDFSEWLFEEVFSTISQWSKAFTFNYKVSLNLSAKQFRNQSLADEILSRCRMHGIKPEAIVLEVTETALIDDPNIAAQTLKKLRRMGFSIALDDFGTGYSSLLYLRNMPLQIVKIDRSFIKDVLFDDENAKIVSAILDLAKTLELEVIAEGVDNTDVKQWLLDHHCITHQGFYFYKPLERLEVEKILSSQSPEQKVVPMAKRKK